MKTILQQFGRPTTEICSMMEMYFNCSESVDYDYKTGTITFKEDGIISSDSYFNAFSYSKWDRYTEIKSVDLEVTIKGTARLYFVKCISCGTVLQESVVDSVHVNTEDVVTEVLHFDFSKEQFEGIAYLKIDAEESAVFYDACYSTDAEITPQMINLALVMCTYKRERYLYNNIDAIKRARNNQLLNTQFEVFVIDNGKTLELQRLDEDYLHLIYNKNVGGSGGFTRGIIEALELKKFTHIILMDDDVLFDPSVLKRTETFLSFVKPKFKECFLGGATLRMDSMNIQLESGAIWNNNILINLKRSLRLDERFNLLSNEIDESKSYTSWVYCCIPTTAINDHDLPLPLFVRGDDMEFGIRHRNEIISMNGIGVWHAPVDGRYSFSMNYYVTRNTLILNALYDERYTGRNAARQLFRDALREICFFRYENVDLYLQAYGDFLRGIDFLKNTDGEQVHQVIGKLCPKQYTYEELEQQGHPFSLLKLNIGLNEGESKGIKRFIRKASLNGYLLPSCFNKRGILENYGVTDLFYAKLNNFYRRSCVVQIDPIGKKGVITKRSRVKAIRDFFRTARMCFRLISGEYEKARASYCDGVSELRTVDFWKQYLGINGT